MIRDILKIIYNEPSYVLQQLLPKTLKYFDLLFSNFSGGYSLFPQRLLIALTAKCPLRCKMCCLWGREGLAKYSYSFFEEKLTSDALANLILSVAKYKTNIILTGGEPFLSPLWWDIAKFAKKKNLRLFVATGGTLLEEEAERICKVVDHLQVSLDGPEEIHNISRGKNSFQQIISGIKKIDKIKKHKRPFINICYTISDVNYFSLVDTIKLVDNLGVKINEFAFQHLEWTDEEQLKKHKEAYKNLFNIDTSFWSGFKYDIKGIDTDVLYNQIKDTFCVKVKNITSIVFRPNIKLKDIKKYYTDASYIPDEFKRKCLSPWNEAFILPSGDVWTCAEYIVGNILEDNFLNIWNNNLSRKLRETINKVKYFPVCKTCASFYI